MFANSIRPCLSMVGLFACALMLGQTSAKAEPSAEADNARAVAAAVQAFYDQTKDVSAAFHQTYVNKLYQRTDRSSGHVVFKKPGMMRWDYDKPNGCLLYTSPSPRDS